MKDFARATVSWVDFGAKAFPRRSAENNNSPPDNCTLINSVDLTIHFITEIPAEIKKAQHKSGDRVNQLKAKYKKTIANMDTTFNKVRIRLCNHRATRPNPSRFNGFLVFVYSDSAGQRRNQETV